MLKLNKKGQASSTFQLLIAAIVALAILGVLMSVLNVIPGMNTKPGDATKTLLKTQTTTPGEEQCTTKVTFDTSNSRLSAEAITTDTGLDATQVYFDNPEGLTQFELIEYQLLKYKQNSSYKVLMCIICSNSINSLEKAIELNKRSNSDNFENLDAIDIEDDQTICIIYPRKTR